MSEPPVGSCLTVSSMMVTMIHDVMKDSSVTLAWLSFPSAHAGASAANPALKDEFFAEEGF